MLVILYWHVIYVLFKAESIKWRDLTQFYANFADLIDVLALFVFVCD